MIAVPCSTQQFQTEQKKAQVLATFQAMQTWPHWQEVYSNCRKESPLSYESFARAVAHGNSSRAAFGQALVESQMTLETFQKYLPEFQKFMALYTAFPGIAMLSDGVDQIWHGMMLITDRYQGFCTTFIGGLVHHLPCSLYELYGIDQNASSCVNKCVPSSCKGNGGGCGAESPRFDRDADPEATKSTILAGTQIFIDAYTLVFGPPDISIWNQLTNL